MNVKSAIIIGISIIISFAIISMPLYKMAPGPVSQDQPQARYEVTRINDVFFILTDTETGKCWARRAQEHDLWDGLTPR